MDGLFARRWRLVPALAAALLGCASSAARTPSADYLRYVAVEVPINEHVVIRWQTREMPLRVCRRHRPASSRNPT